jgi:RHS repeat-associated protein
MRRAVHAFFVAFLFIFFASTTSAQHVVTYFHNDISGSPIVATNAAGSVVWKASYRPYGDRVPDEFPTTNTNASNKIGYAGSPFDASTGLSYMGARYYDPVLGRFMGIDPVGFQEDNVHSFNRYAYANNNPYRYIDRDGRQSTDILYNVWNRAFSNSSGPNANGAAGFEIAKQGSAQGYFDGLSMAASVGLTVSPLGLGGRSMSEAVNLTAHAAYKDGLRAAMSKPATSDATLTSIVDKLYRPNATVGSGSTAAAVRLELATGQPVGGAFHSQKAADGITNLSRWLSGNPKAIAADRAAAENIMRDMGNALRGQ